MIERKIVNDRITEFAVEKYLRESMRDVPIERTTYDKTPLGERITVYTSAPGLVIGREGSNIKKVTKNLKAEFGFENPQVKIGDVTEPSLSAPIVAKIIANSLERFGSQKFKFTAFKAINSTMYAGAMGIEIRITGKIPSSRSKSWLFNKGYLKKTGYVSDFLVDHAKDFVTLKTGVVGIKVSIMKPNTPLPDKIEYTEDYKTVADAVGVPEDKVEEIIAEVVTEVEVSKEAPKSEEVKE